MNPYDLISSGSPESPIAHLNCRRTGALLFGTSLLFLSLPSCRKGEPRSSAGDLPAAATTRNRSAEKKAEPPPTLAELKAAARDFLSTPQSKDISSFALHQLCDRARPADLAALLDTLDLNDRVNDPALAAIFFSLGGKDPALFLKRAAGLDATSFILRRPFLSPLLETDRKAVIDWMAHDPHETAASRAMFTELSACLTEADPGALLPLLNEVSDPWQRMKLQRSAFQTWGQLDFHSALAYAQGTSTGDDLEMNLVDIVRGAAAGHPQEALEFLRGQSLAFPSNLCEAFFTAGFAAKDPQRALAAMTELPMPTLQQLLLAHPSQAGEFTALSPALAQQALTGVSLDEASLPAFTSVALALLKNDAEAAIAWGNTFPPGEEKNRLLTSLFARWSDVDSAASRTALLQLTDPSLRGSALEGLASGLVAKDSAAAMSFGRTLPLELQGAYAADALGWLLKSPPGTVAASRLVNSPELSPEMISSPEFQEKLTATGANLAALAIDPAKNWLNHLSEDRRPAAAEGVAASWLKSDPTSAIDWIQSLDSGDTRDAAVGALVRELESTDPQSAGKWRQEIGKR